MKFNKSFFKKFFLITGGGLLVLIATLAVIYTVLNIKWGGELRSELEKLRNAGEPMTIKEIAPAPLPSSENASVEYLQIFSLMTDGIFSMKGPEQDNKDFKELNDLLFSSKNMPEFEDQCSKNSARLHELLDKDNFKQIFELCQKAAAKPGMNFNLNYEDGPAMTLPHLSKMRSITRLLRVKAELELLEGQREKGWETMLTSLKLGAQLKTEPTLISQLVYFACNSICFEFIAYNLPRYGISDEQAGKVISELAPERTEYAKSMKKAFDAERVCFGGWMFERLISGKISARQFSQLTEMNSNEPNSFLSGPFIITVFLYKPFIKRDYLEYLKIMKNYKDVYDQPYYKASASLEKDNEYSIKAVPLYCIITRMLCPALENLRKNTAKTATRSQEIRLRLALEEYKNLKMAYPEKLELLSPQFLKEIPVSEMTGKPFEYSKDKDSYNISGGPAKKD